MPKCSLEDISSEEILWFVSYWTDKRGDRAMPRREDMVPEELARILPNLMIIDRAEGEYRIRLVGTEITERYGMDVTGKKLSDAGMGASEPYWISIYDELFADPRPLFGRDNYYWQERDYVKFEWAGVPLSTDGKTVTQLMGCIIFTS